VSEFRKDPIVGRWVVIAPERALRPIDVPSQPTQVEMPFDPFAVGNESGTTAEILAFRDAGTVPDGPGWRVRVIPNKYPAVQFAASMQTHSDGIYESVSGQGTHEVIIECPHTEPNLSRLSVANITEVLAAYRDRMIELKKDPRLAHVVIFKNQGPLAGASVHHSHSQLMATPFVPQVIVEELNGAMAHYQRSGRNIFEAMIEQERATASRVVVETPRFLAFCPYASRFAYETWILPRHSGSHYEQTDQAALTELGSVLKLVLCKLELGLNDPDFNYVVYTAPFREPDLPHYRWHIRIFPRMSGVAGFEWGSGCHINQVPPELAAERLREAPADHLSQLA
jgi:UDPglucose--hexose-1-phosphate uridylyltransferase